MTKAERVCRVLAAADAPLTAEELLCSEVPDWLGQCNDKITRIEFVFCRIDEYICKWRCRVANICHLG